MCMADLKLQLNEEKELDLIIENNDFTSDDTINTSIELSITKKRYDKTTSQNGWAAEKILPSDRQQGSRLYLVMQQPITDQSTNLVNKYVYEALEWLIEDKVAESISVSSERVDTNRIDFSVTITKPNDKEENFDYYLNWSAQNVQNRNA